MTATGTTVPLVNCCKDATSTCTQASSKDYDCSNTYSDPILALGSLCRKNQTAGGGNCGVTSSATVTSSGTALLSMDSVGDSKSIKGNITLGQSCTIRV